MDGDWTRSEYNLAKCDDNVRSGRTRSHAPAESNAGTVGTFSPSVAWSVGFSVKNVQKSIIFLLRQNSYKSTKYTSGHKTAYLEVRATSAYQTVASEQHKSKVLCIRALNFRNEHLDYTLTSDFTRCYNMKALKLSPSVVFAIHLRLRCIYFASIPWFWGLFLSYY